MRDSLARYGFVFLGDSEETLNADPNELIGALRGKWSFRTLRSANDVLPSPKVLFDESRLSIDDLPEAIGNALADRDMQAIKEGRRKGAKD